LGPPSNVPLPDAVAPVPSPAQVAWQTRELAAFLHFGMNTFTNKEQGDGSEDPALFNPTAFDARQWITTLRNAGFREALFTAKHHDGFCLWPTKCTTHSVTASPFRGGSGDVVREFVDAAHEGNVRVAFALSPLDRHDPSYGTPAYLSVFECQLTELLTNYGAVDEIWLWGLAPGEPTFDWAAIRDLVHRLQPQTLLELANAAPMLESELRSIAQSSPSIPPPPSDQSNVQSPGGAAGTPQYIPAEAVYMIRPSWFWHASEDAQVKTVDQLMGNYFDAVGRNSFFV
jgi:alpha-L-fucosidase